MSFDDISYPWEINLSMDFHLVELNLDISSLNEIEKLASRIAKHIRYTQPFLGCIAYIESPDESGYIARYKNIPGYIGFKNSCWRNLEI